MTKTELAKQVREVSYLSGKFTLRSGQISDFYWDKYRFESNPNLLTEIAAAMVKLLPTEVEGLAGLELGGIPLVTAISLQTGIPCYFVRKEAKSYGTCNLIEGGVQEKSKLVVIEDVITTAGQVCTSISQIREAGHTVEHVVAVIDRQAGGKEKINRCGCSFSSVFTLAELEIV